MIVFQPTTKVLMSLHLDILYLNIHLIFFWCGSLFQYVDKGLDESIYQGVCSN